MLDSAAALFIYLFIYLFILTLAVLSNLMVPNTHPYLSVQKEFFSYIRLGISGSNGISV